MNKDLPEPLRRHRQLERASCAASGFESVAKLHGLIAPDAFPLQSDPANQGMGFGDTQFLLSHELEATEAHLDREAALDLIEAESIGSRFPLISLLAVQTGGKRYWHIFVCTQYGGALLLIDPAVPTIQARGRSGVSAEFQRTLDAALDRQTIHILTYHKVK